MAPSVQLLVILVALLAFWFIVMRPARVQQRKMRELQQQLQVGDEVILSAGIFGTIRSLDGARVELEVAPGTVLTVARQVVVRRASEVESGGTGWGAEAGDVGPRADPDAGGTDSTGREDRGDTPA